MGEAERREGAGEGNIAGTFPVIILSLRFSAELSDFDAGFKNRVHAHARSYIESVCVRVRRVERESVHVRARARACTLCVYACVYGWMLADVFTRNIWTAPEIPAFRERGLPYSLKGEKRVGRERAIKISTVYPLSARARARAVHRLRERPAPAPPISARDVETGL